MKRLPFVVLLLALSALYAGQALAVKESRKENHKEYAEMKISECNDCHKTEGISPNHTGDWVRIHRVPASKAGHNCAQCHGQDYCLDCHQGGGITADLNVDNFRRDYEPRSHRSDFITLHPIKAQDNPQTCYRCHDQKYCNQCHSKFPRGSLRIKSHFMLGPNGQQYNFAINEHQVEARRNLQSCQACHPEGDVCIQCHAAGKTGSAARNPHPGNWRDIKNNYRDRAGDRVCIQCHIPGTF